jgi:hypothetical protein
VASLLRLRVPAKVFIGDKDKLSNGGDDIL